jgi:glycolate oxidase FAD binding subunit
VFAAAAASGARATIEWCPTELKRRVNIWGEPREDFPLMQKLKKVFDPQGILSAGRFVGGL